MVGDQVYLNMCQARLASDLREDVREDMRREAVSRKLNKVELPKLLAELKGKSHPKILLEKAPENLNSKSMAEADSNQAVALIYDTIPITREQYGEWLIARYGTKEIENLINRRIVERAVREKGIELLPIEVDAEIKQTLKRTESEPGATGEKPSWKPLGRNMVYGLA